MFKNTMQNDLVIAVLAGLGGMLGWGLADFFAKKTIDQIGDIASLAWGHIFGTGVLVAVAVYQALVMDIPFVLPGDLRTWLILILFGTGQAAVYLFVYKGFGKGQVGVLSPVFASFSGLTALLSITIFGEDLGGLAFFGLTIVFLGILLVNADLGALKAKRFSFTHVPGFREIGVATLMAGLWTLFWGRFLGGQDWFTYTLVMYTVMTVVILVVARYRSIPLTSVPRPVWKFLALIGITETGAYLAVTLGYSYTTMISVVALLSGAFSLPTMVLARMFLKEKISAVQTVGSIVIVGGIILLYANQS